MAVSIYLEIKEKMLEVIKQLPANSPVLSERDLAQKYNVSRMTVRKSIEALVQEGYLYRDANKGTFVADPKLKKKNTALIEEENELTYKMIYFDVKVTSRKEVQENLGIRDDDSVVRMIRLVLKDDRPYCIEKIYQKRVDLDDDEVTDMTNWKKFNTSIADTRLTQKFVPMIVPVQYAHLLGLKVQTPIIMVENTYTTKDGKPLVYMKVYYNPNEKTIEIIQ